MTFADVSAVEPVGEGRFTADVHPNWTIAGKPNGGYLLAILGRAAVATGPHPHVLTAAATYLRPPDPGPVELHVDVLRAGRSASQLRVQLRQDGTSCVDALLTTTQLAADTTPYWDSGLPAAYRDGPTERDDGIRVPPVNPAGVPVPIMGEVDLRLERESLGFAGRRGPSGRGELYGWLALPDDEPFDPVSLLYAVDAFPPATFDIEMSGWVPTFQLTAYVRALPAPGPVRVLHRAGLIQGQRVDEACWVWDSRGRAVSHSVQLAGIRLPAG